MTPPNTPKDIRELPRNQKLKLALIIAGCIAAGVALGFAPERISSLGGGFLGVILTTVGAIGTAAGAILDIRSGRMILGILWGLTALGLALLAIPAWRSFLELM
ncbi:MAG: hypothetical protein WAW37_02040 [Syntrophobacteraceae bacterium]